MIKKQIWLAARLAIILLVGLIVFAGSAAAEVDCDGISHWSTTDPPINQVHVFCGEWNQRKKRPSGFHSRPDGKTPTTVRTLKITQKPNVQGLYGVRWSYAGHPDREKFSSMFPDTCSRGQILKSIAYAANNPQKCPKGSPRWAKCGPNKPFEGGEGFCKASDNSIFTIAFATHGNGIKINTAFPLVE